MKENELFSLNRHCTAVHQSVPLGSKKIIVIFHIQNFKKFLKFVFQIQSQIIDIFFIALGAQNSVQRIFFDFIFHPPYGYRIVYSGKNQLDFVILT